MLLASPLSPSTLLSGSTALLVLAVILFAECGLLIGFFLPGDTLLFAAGISIATGNFSTSLTAFLIVCPIAAVVGNLVGYAVGYRAGPVVFDRPNSKIFRPEFVDRTHRFYERFALYALYSTVGGIIWTDGMLLIGHSLGHVRFVQDHKDDVDYIVIVAVLLTVVPLGIHYLQGRRRGRSDPT